MNARTAPTQPWIRSDGQSADALLDLLDTSDD